MTMVLAALNWLLSPVGRVLAAAGGALIFILTVFSKGRIAGRKAEREKTRKVVNKVQKKMDAETRRPRSINETRKRMRDGSF